MKIVKYLVLIVVMVIFGCAKDQPTTVDYSNCRFQEPKQVFDTIITSQFQLFPDRSEEYIYWKGAAITLTQHGCDTIHQDWKFFKHTSDPIQDIKKDLHSLVVHEKYIIIAIMADSINSSMFYQQVESQPGFFMKVETDKSYHYLLTKMY